MKEKIKLYIDKIITYLPVAVFMFTIVFFIQVAAAVDDLKAEYGVDAIDVLVDLYSFYFYRTILLTLFVPLYDIVLSNNKLSYWKAMVLHYFLILITVGVLFYEPGSPSQALLLMFGLCTLIYLVIRLIIFLREKQFVDDANKIFLENNKND